MLVVSVGRISLRGQTSAKLKLSLPPTIDSFPIAFANDQNIFEKHGLTVELVGIPNRTQRDVALFSGSVDGALTDIASVLRLIAADAPVKITSTAFETIDDSRRYSLMTHHFSNITDLSTLLKRLDGQKGRTIGLLKQTDMEFETDRLIAAQGANIDESKLYSNYEDIVLLATLLGQGSILAAVLPEPIGSYLEYITRAEGVPVVLLADYKNQKLTPSVMAFQTRLIEESPDRIERFYDGYQEVISLLATLPREQVVEVGVNAALQFFFPGLKREELPPGAEEFIQKYLIPAFPPPRALLTEEFQSVSSWSLEKGYLRAAIPFELAFTNQFNGS
jgi:ABC-type nitrate/sulfonate/bicarbonate transport system substrate-binding protein